MIMITKQTWAIYILLQWNECSSSKLFSFFLFLKRKDYHTFITWNSLITLIGNRKWHPENEKPFELQTDLVSSFTVEAYNMDIFMYDKNSTKP